MRQITHVFTALFFCASIVGCTNQVDDASKQNTPTQGSSETFKVILNMDDSNSAFGVANVKRFFDDGEEATLIWTCGENMHQQLTSLFGTALLSVPMGTIDERIFVDGYVNPSQLMILGDTNQVLAVSNKVEVSNRSGSRCALEYTFPRVDLNKSPFAVDLSYWGNGITWFNYSDDLATEVIIPIQVLRQTVK